MIFYSKYEQTVSINDLVIHLPAPIWNIDELRNLVIVTFDPDYSNTNISAYDYSGNLVWTIEKLPFEFPYPNAPKGYNGIAIRDEGLVAWSYIDSLIDEKTGRIIKTLPFSK